MKTKFIFLLYLLLPVCLWAAPLQYNTFTTNNPNTTNVAGYIWSNSPTGVPVLALSPSGGGGGGGQGVASLNGLSNAVVLVPGTGIYITVSGQNISVGTTESRQAGNNDDTSTSISGGPYTQVLFTNNGQGTLTKLHLSDQITCATNNYALAYAYLTFYADGHSNQCSLLSFFSGWGLPFPIYTSPLKFTWWGATPYNGWITGTRDMQFNWWTNASVVLSVNLGQLNGENNTDLYYLIGTPNASGASKYWWCQESSNLLGSNGVAVLFTNSTLPAGPGTLEYIGRGSMDTIELSIYGEPAFNDQRQVLFLDALGFYFANASEDAFETGYAGGSSIGTGPVHYATDEAGYQIGVWLWGVQLHTNFYPGSGMSFQTGQNSYRWVNGFSWTNTAGMVWTNGPSGVGWVSDRWLVTGFTQN